MDCFDYHIYTDGACAGNPGPGGWGAVMQSEEGTKEISGSAEETTNQRMELTAAIEALKLLAPGQRVRLYSDSAYLVNCFNQCWYKRWLKNGWLNARGEPVDNRDLWEKLLELDKLHKIDWIKVKGHSDNAGNNRADELARNALLGKDITKPAQRVSAKPIKTRRIGLLTGGGDCPGLNAVIRAVVKGATYNYDMEVIGFNDGFKGLVENNAALISDRAVSGILNRGGTILGTSNRDNPFDFKMAGSDYRQTGDDRSADALNNIRKWDIECLVVIGGDGSLFLAHRFSELGLPVIGIPKTIDNDLPATDVTFGFDSAVTTATEAIDKIHTTAESHHRVMVVEVMGRDAGWIALQAGMAGGGDIILIPELPFCYDEIVKTIDQRRERGKKFSIIVVAEGAHPQGEKPVYQDQTGIKRLGGIGRMVSEEVEKRTKLESRATVLGHLQRGGSPTPYDRVLATRFGAKAVELFRDRQFNRMVCLKGDKIDSVPLDLATKGIKRVDPQSEQVRDALAVGTSFGCQI